MSTSQTVAVAESLTGGLLASSFVEVSGASTIFKGGVIVYSLDSKIRLLGVDEKIAKVSRGVDMETSKQMARGVAQLFNSAIGISTTGFAETYEDRRSEAYISLYMTSSNSFISALIVNQGLTRNEFRAHIVTIAKKMWEERPTKD